MTKYCLIVCAAPAPGSEEHVARLAAGADIVIAVDGGLAVCRSAAVMPDLIIGDLDSVADDVLAEARAAGVAVDEYPPDKDLTDLDLALERAGEMADAVVVCACTAGRIDHGLAVFGSLSRFGSPARIDEPQFACWFLAEDVLPGIELTGKGATVSVLALSDTAEVSCTGTRWPLDHALVPLLGSRGMSNIIEGQSATFTVHAGRVAVLTGTEGGLMRAHARV